MGSAPKAKPAKAKDEVSLLDLLAFLRNSLPYLLVFVSLTASVTYWRYSLKPSYTADGLMNISSSRSNPFLAVTEKLSGINGSMHETDQKMDHYLLLFQSRDFHNEVAQQAEQLGKRPELSGYLAAPGPLPGRQPASLDDLAQQIYDFTEITRSGNDSFRMRISLPDPEHAVATLNILMDAFTAAIVGRESTELAEAKKFLQQQTKEIEGRLASLDDEIARHGRSLRGQLSSGAQTTASAQNTEDRLEQAVLLHRQQLSEVQALIAEASRQLEHEQDRNAASDKYSAAIGLENLRRRESLLRIRYESTKKLLDESRANPATAMRVEHTIQDLYKRKELEYHMLSDLQKELVALDVQQISARNKIRVLDRPRISGIRTSETLRPLLIKRCLFAAILALLITLMRELTNPFVRGRGDVQLPALTYFGSIPDLRKAPHSGNWGRRFRHRLRHLWRSWKRIRQPRPEWINLAGSNSYHDMMFNNVSARLLSSSGRGGAIPKVISIMSSTPGEGKTTLSGRLAQEIARGGKRVLLVDSDLRRRSLSERLGFGAEPGLTEYLGGDTGAKNGSKVKRVAENLDLLPAGGGSGNPTRHFTGSSFKELLEAMRHYYDVVILDTPPVVPCPEVIPIAQLSDLVVLTVTVGITRIEYLDDCIDKLSLSPQTRVGYVLNMHDTVGGYGYYSAYSRGPRDLSQAA